MSFDNEEWTIYLMGYSRKNPNRGVEDMEFPGISKK